MRGVMSWVSAVAIVAATTASARAANSVQCDNGFPKLVVNPNNANLTDIQAKGTVTTDAGWTCLGVDGTVTAVRNARVTVVGSETTIPVVNNAWGMWTFGPYSNDTYTVAITATFQNGTMVETKTISYTVTITGAGQGNVVQN